MDINQANPKIEAIESWDEDDLLKWFETHHPKLLKGDEPDKLRKRRITGMVFLISAGDVDFFEKRCELPIGTAVMLANLASKIKGRETVGRKSKLLSFIPCTPRRLQANNVTGRRQQAEDVEMTDTNGKLLSFIPCTP